MITLLRCQPESLSTLSPNQPVAPLGIAAFGEQIQRSIPLGGGLVDGLDRLKRQRKVKRRLGQIAAVIGLLLLSLLAADYLLYPRWSKVGGRSFNTGRNGSWLRDSWYLGTATEKPEDLARQLTQHHIRYAHFHVRHIKKDRTLQYRENPEETRRMTATLRQRLWLK